MKTVTYVRVSSKDQEDGFSPAAQLKLLKKYASEKGHKIVKEFRDVESAKQAGREKFNLMIEFLKQNQDVKYILCEKTDRLSRNFRDIAILDELINDQNLNIVLVKENTILSRDSKSHEKFIFGIKALMAKNYIDNLSEETRKGLTEKASQGIYPSSAPFGYKNCEAKHQGKTLKYISIDDMTAPIVQRLFQLYATSDYSLKMLTKEAYSLGLKSKRGQKVSKATVHKMLQNPIYYGDFVWGKKLYHGTHKPIITKQLFDTVQEAFSAHNKPKLTKKRFAYRGLMVCGDCGCAITAEIHKGKYIYYHCTGSKGGCKKDYIREEELDRQFGKIIKMIQIDDDTLEEVKTALKDSHQDELEFHKKRISILTAQKTKLDNRLHHIYIDKIDGKVSEEFYERNIDKWQEELDEINESIARHENADSNYLTRGVHILELCNKAHRLYLQQTPYERAGLLKYVLSNCTLSDGSLTPTYRKPFHLLAEGLHRTEWGE